MALWVHDGRAIGFSNDEDWSWMRFGLSHSGVLVRFESSGYTDLSPDDCRILAAWLNRQANRIEGRPAFFGRQVAVTEPEGVA